MKCVHTYQALMSRKLWLKGRSLANGRVSRASKLWTKSSGAAERLIHSLPHSRKSTYLIPSLGWRYRWERQDSFLHVDHCPDMSTNKWSCRGWCAAREGHARHPVNPRRFPLPCCFRKWSLGQRSKRSRLLRMCHPRWSGWKRKGEVRQTQTKAIQYNAMQSCTVQSLTVRLREPSQAVVSWTMVL